MRATNALHLAVLPLRPRTLAVRLATSPADVRAAQALRYRVFHDECGAACGGTEPSLDGDAFDAVADHLIVEDLAADPPHVVGTYRMLRQDVAEPRGGFYSAREFDLTPLLAHADKASPLLELGRSCVAPEYRDSGTIQTLWRGIADYLIEHGVSYMFGCASLPGTDPDACADALSYLAHDHLAPATLRATAHQPHRAEMARLPVGSYDQRRAMRRLPPLIKAYLRAGATVGDGAWIDREFGCIDVFVVMPVEAIAARYSDRFSARKAA